MFVRDKSHLHRCGQLEKVFTHPSTMKNKVRITSLEIIFLSRLRLLKQSKPYTSQNENLQACVRNTLKPT